MPASSGAAPSRPRSRVTNSTLFVAVILVVAAARICTAPREPSTDERRSAWAQFLAKARHRLPLPRRQTTTSTTTAARSDAKAGGTNRKQHQRATTTAIVFSVLPSISFPRPAAWQKNPLASYPHHPTTTTTAPPRPSRKICCRASHPRSRDSRASAQSRQERPHPNSRESNETARSRQRPSHEARVPEEWFA